MWYAIIGLWFIFAVSPSLFGQINYDLEIQPIFTQSCGGSACHITHSVGGVNMASYENVINSEADRYGKLILPFDATNSPLIDKLNPNPRVGVQMPLEQDPLSKNQIELIEKWINEGALQIATANEDYDEGISDGFKLIGNYPNPFNPSTQIQFHVPVATQYTISIYTIYGQLIGEQVGNISAGQASILISLVSKPTGIYLYKVIAQTSSGNKFIGSGSMTLIK